MQRCAQHSMQRSTQPSMQSSVEACCSGEAGRRGAPLHEALAVGKAVAALKRGCPRRRAGTLAAEATVHAVKLFAVRSGHALDLVVVACHARPPAEP
jgi:hypothetical protein